MIDYAREIAEARDFDLDDDIRYELEQDALEAESDDLHNQPSGYSPYRCTDRMCGALDCSNCHPEGFDEAPIGAFEEEP